MTELERLRAESADLNSEELIVWSKRTFGSEGVTVASSLGAEDQVITHMVAERARDLSVFTLDTGRLHQETYDTLQKTRTRYGMDIAVLFPDRGGVEEIVRRHGPNLFYTSVEFRKLCCHVRKVEPLARALSGKRAWICGLRRGQTATRAGVERISWDETNGLYKIAPLAFWSEEQVWEFIRTHDVPYNPLHDQSFPSIGCAPCTRAILPGEDIRSGRWWWEQEDRRECGLHTGEPASARPGFGIATVSPGAGPIR